MAVLKPIKQWISPIMATKTAVAPRSSERKRVPLVDRLKEMRKLMDAHDKEFAKLKPIVDRIDALREGIINEFTADELKSVTAGGLIAKRVVTPCPTVKDQLAFLAFATKKANWDLLQRSVNTPAWRERMTSSNRKRAVIPGVQPFNRVSLSVQREKKP